MTKKGQGKLKKPQTNDPKRAEEALSSLDDKFDLAFRHSPSAMGITTLQEGRFIDVNDRFLQDLGYRRDEVIGRTIADLKIWVEIADRKAMKQELERSGFVKNHEYRFRDKQGSIHWVITSATKIDNCGEPCILTQSLDISERKKTEDDLKKSEGSYRTIFESTATANLIVAEDTTILMANENFAALSGYSKEELEGKISWTIFIHDDDLEKMKTNHKMRRIDPASVPSSYEFRAINRHGKILHLFASTAVIPGTKVSVISMLDLTERRNLETQLVQVQKMEFVGRLAGGVAHDFNNMLSVIMGNTELALLKIDPSDPLRKTLQDILNAGKRSADLTRQLLAFARKQTISPKVMDLNETVSGMLKMLQRLIGEDIRLNWNPGHSIWKVKIDPSQVDQLLANLSVNARDAIEKTGQIIIATSNEICDEAYCANNPDSVPGEYVMLAVSDNGCGMDNEIISNIFEPFFTTKKEGQGTGLGLATTYGIVRQNGGFINVYSEPRQGTTFKIFLPRYSSGSVESEADEKDAGIQGGTETILIVEDEEGVLALARSMLEGLGYHVLAVRKTEEAIALVKEHKDIDLLLTDIIMPDMNGKELLENLSSIKPALKCLYMSGYTADVITRQGILEEGVHFIPKPFSLYTLAAKVREALGK